MDSPGIIMTGKFIRPGSGAFQSYIDYLDREKAVRNEAYESYSAFTSTEGTSGLYEGEGEETLAGYIKYMVNPVKTSNLFTLASNCLDEADIAELKSAFITASENGSPMWQDVFSFRNEWLIAHGYLDAETNQLDEAKLQLATRLGMNAMLKKEDMLHSAIWTASIHYNTDNIHIHVATVEPEPTREMHTFVDKESNQEVTERKGYRSRASLRAMKSAFANQLIGLEKERTTIDRLKKQMIEGMRAESGVSTLQRNEHLLQAIIEKLPPQKGYQKYGYAEKFGFKKTLDRMIELLLKDNYADLLEEIQERQRVIAYEEEAAFGEGRNSSENKLDTLYTRLGNAILNHIKELDLQPKMKQHAQLDPAVFEAVDETFQAVNHAKPRSDNERSKQKYSPPKIRYDPAQLDAALKMIADHAETEKDRPSEAEIAHYFQSVREKKWQQMNPDKEPRAVEVTSARLQKEPEKESEAFDQAFHQILANDPNYYDEEPRVSPMPPMPDAYVDRERDDLSRLELASYEQLFDTQHETVRQTFRQRKERIKRDCSSTHHESFAPLKLQKKPKLSVKEREAQQKNWQEAIDRRKQLNQLDRVLKDTTEQWRNEQQYQKMLHEIEQAARYPSH